MTSLRAAAASLGIFGDFTIMKDVMGFWGTKVPQLMEIAPKTISLKQHLSALRGPRVDIIWANLRDLTADEMDKQDAAIHFTRALYERDVGVTVGRVQHMFAPGAAPRFLVLEGDSEFEALVEEFSGPDGSVDVFAVDDLLDSNGKSPEGGDCDKQNRSGLDGLAIPFFAGDTPLMLDFYAQILAHELAHFLGLDHPCGDAGECDGDCEISTSNLMVQGSCHLDLGGSPTFAVHLNDEQAACMRDSCAVHTNIIPF